MNLLLVSEQKVSLCIIQCKLCSVSVNSMYENLAAVVEGVSETVLNMLDISISMLLYYEKLYMRMCLNCCLVAILSFGDFLHKLFRSSFVYLYVMTVGYCVLALRCKSFCI